MALGEPDVFGKAELGTVLEDVAYGVEVGDTKELDADTDARWVLVFVFVFVAEVHGGGVSLFRSRCSDEEGFNVCYRPFVAAHVDGQHEVCDVPLA